MLRYWQVFQGRERRGANPSFQLGWEEGRPSRATPQLKTVTCEMCDLTSGGVGVRMSANSHLGSLSYDFAQHTKGERFHYSDREVVATTRARIVLADARIGASVFWFEHVGTTVDHI